MGASYSSHTNLSNDCTSFEAGATGTTARWGSSFEISMGNWKENNDKTEVWGVEYQTGQKKRTCGFQLKASHNKSGGGVESIFFGLGDTTSENKTEFALNISRVGRDGLHGGITGIDSTGPPKSFTRAKQDCSIETTIVSYGCSYREGLFVLEMKKKVKCESAYMVTLAHYYVTKDVALSIAAKISRKGNGFVVKVEGPFKHPSNDLRKVLVKTCRTGIWSPGACSHCKAEKQSSSDGGGATRNGGSNSSSLKGGQSSSQQSDDIAAGQIVKSFFASNVREQSNKGFINSSGYTSGYLNHSVIFIGCNF